MPSAGLDLSLIHISLIKLFAYLLLAVHWMNPLCWAAFFLMNRDMEMSCDEDVLAREENAQSAYSAALLDVALSQRPAVSGPPAFGKRVLRARIRNALHWKKPSRWMTASAAVLCAAGLFFPVSYTHLDVYKRQQYGYGVGNG